MRNLVLIVLFITAVSGIVSCNSEYKRNPGKVYAPDMFYSRAVDYYNSTEKIEAAGGKFNKMPAKGSIARGMDLPDHLGEFDTLAAYAKKCNITLDETDLAAGERLYLIQCGICHGKNLDGNGPLYNDGNGKFAAMPANLKGPNYLNMSEGKMYYAIMYGKNMMGSYASQLDSRQRWQVIAYIKKVQSENGGAAFTMLTNSTNSETAKAVETKLTEEKPTVEKK